MKKFLFFTFSILFSLSILSQELEDLGELVNSHIENGASEEAIGSLIKGVVKDPILYNTLWGELLNRLDKRDSLKWRFFRDLNLNFKTFQTIDSSGLALGLSYDVRFNYARYKEDGSKRTSHAFGVDASGNVAFSKKANPFDFLVADVNYSFSQFMGGVVDTDDNSYLDRMDELEDMLAALDDPNSLEAQSLWDEYGKSLGFTNQYYYSLSPKFGLESNQDFSIMQFTPGVKIFLGAKAWNKKNTLAKLNILDYPFALFRYLTGTDHKFTVYGSTLPTAMLTFDYVIPQDDTLRENLLGELEPFPRISIEIGFRTIVSRIKKESIFFNANFRYYYELGAATEIIDAEMDQHLYFVMALQSSTGFYASYAYGKLPFDARNDQVYSLGFNFKF